MLKTEDRSFDSLRCHLVVTWVRLSQEYFLGGKGGRYIGLRVLPNFIIIIIIIIITAIQLSLCSSSPYTSTDRTNKNKYT